ncbi:MAG: dockerin type I repeat-containing protein, partial [Ruminococcus sp.]|nr:dockerin type I repeat-containing protein [Ruminococcus sp.]
QPSLGTAANNAMKYTGGMYTYYSGVLDDTDKIYYFAVAERSYMSQSVIWHGYNGQTYTEYSYNYYATPVDPTYDYDYQVLPIRFTINEPTYVAIFYDPTMNRVYINNNYDDKINILAPYEFSSLSVFPGRSSNGSSGRFLTIYPDSDDYVYQMEKQGDIYRYEFKNVPAGENYCFTLIADPNPNYQANIEYFCRSPYDSQFEFGGEWTPNIPTGASETRYDAEIAGSLIKFNLDINADVEIIFDASEYNEETGANGKITLKITPIKGDVNGDGIVDITDATALQMYLAQFEELTPAQQANADVDGDGYLTIKDVTMIQKYLANLIDSL